MKPKVKNGSGVYAYLDTLGLLATSDESAIQKAKKKYWQAYKKTWRQNKRNSLKSTTVYLNQDEYKTIEEAAYKHKRCLSKYVKEAALYYTAQRFLVPDILLVNQLKETLTMNYCALQKLFEENMLPYNVGKILLERLTEIEQQVVEMLHKPKRLNSNNNL